MTNSAEVRAHLHGWAVMASSLPETAVIFAGQDGAQPDLPYLTLQIGKWQWLHRVIVGHVTRTLTRSESLAETENGTVPGNMGSVQPHSRAGEATLTVQAFGGPDPMGLLLDMRMWSGLSSSRDRLAHPDIAIMEFGDPRDLTALIDSSWQLRAAMDVRINAILRRDDDPGIIEDVEITARLDHQPDDPSALIDEITITQEQE